MPFFFKKKINFIVSFFLKKKFHYLFFKNIYIFFLKIMSIEITNKKRGRRHARHNINKKKDLKKRVKTYKMKFYPLLQQQI